VGPDASTTNLDRYAYLERIHGPSAIDFAAPEPPLSLLRALHLAHLLAVPFENLSIHYGEPIRLEDEMLYDKIVRRRRGGFCYELNGLFAWLLRLLGFSVTLLSARVAQADGGFSPEFDHMALLVHDLEHADWLADVGFGDSFRQPLHLQPDVEQDGGDGYRYRLRFHASDSTDSDHTTDASSDTSEASGVSWLMQRRADPQGSETDWQSQYRFTVQPHVMADFADRCHFQETSPDSHFTQKRICSLALPDGRITLSDWRLITTLHGVRVERDLASEDEYRAILAEWFAITL
jgi:N-hydroxyarylamine O-acetyltransferase